MLLKFQKNLKIFSVSKYLIEKKEKELENNIKCLSNISNKISRKVKEQYEDNPYPRWFSTELEYRPLSIMEFIKRAELKTKMNV